MVRATPKVTIAIPVYNGGDYFRLTLESALAQQYENLEIVVVNDGSTDGGKTDAVAREYGERIRYISQENQGVGGALNTAIAHMTGDYFAWLSADDLHLPHKTRRQIDYLTRMGRPDAILFSDYDLIDADGKKVASAKMPHARIMQTPMLPLLNGMINGCTLLIPAWIMRKYGPFDPSLRFVQDYSLWNTILAKHEFFHQPEILIEYRIHPDQGTHKPGAVTEGDALWKRMVDSRSEVERAQLFGSTQRYFSSLAKFLDETPYKEAAAYTHARAVNVDTDVLVSVIIPFWNEVPLTLRAVRSALDQTHRNVEVVLIDDGSTEDITPLTLLAETDSRLCLVRQQNAGPGAARNRALNKAQGAYIAFLDADDRFLPHKIERQLQQMQKHGALFSHTSYYIDYPSRMQGFGLSHSGKFGGACYPQIISDCPIAMPTVMLHRSLIDEGFAFPTELQVGEDVLGWIDLAMRYTLLGIDEPLSIVEWTQGSAALNTSKQISGLSGQIEALARHPLHHRQGAEIEKLRSVIRTIARDWVATDRQIEAVEAGNVLTAVFQENPHFPIGTRGRTPPLVAS